VALRDEEEDSHRQLGLLRKELIPVSGTSSQQGLLGPIKPAYDQRRPDGWLC